MRLAPPRLVARIGTVALLTFCQCSFLFDLGVLDRGGPAAGGDAASDDTQTPDSDDGGVLDEGDDGAEVGSGADDSSAAGDAAYPDATPDDVVLFDAAPDWGATEAGPDGGTKDGAPDARTMDAPLDVTAESGSVDAVADGVAPVDAPAATGLAAGLTALYPFDETSGTTSADASGNNQTATMQGATFSAGLQNDAATMNGATQYVSLPAGIVSGLTAFSVCAWVDLNAALQHTHIFDFGTGTSVYMFLTPNDGSGILQFAITTTGVSGEQTLNATAPLAVGSWQHVCVTASGTTGTLYVAGVQAAQNPSMTLNPASLGSTTQNWLGRSQFSGDPYLNGKIDELRIYDRALSAAEVKQLFQQKL